MVRAKAMTGTAIGGQATAGPMNAVQTNHDPSASARGKDTRPSGALTTESRANAEPQARAPINRAPIVQGKSRVSVRQCVAIVRFAASDPNAASGPNEPTGPTGRPASTGRTAAGTHTPGAKAGRINQSRLLSCRVQISRYRRRRRQKQRLPALGFMGTMRFWQP